jgi:acetyl-CoA carboxylase carboxyltransferase component
VVHRCHDFGMEKNKIPGDGVVTGHGTIDGRTVFVFSQDFTVFGGSLSGPFGEKVCKVMDLAVGAGAPIIGLNDSGGARIQEGVVSLAPMARYSGATCCLGRGAPDQRHHGPLRGRRGLQPAITDFIFMVDQTSYMHITGPQVIKTVTGEEVTSETLGGAKVHNRTSGVAQFLSKTDEECLEDIRKLLSYLPSSWEEKPPRGRATDPVDRETPELDSHIPDSPKAPYNMKAPDQAGDR